MRRWHGSGRWFNDDLVRRAASRIAACTPQLLSTAPQPRAPAVASCSAGAAGTLGEGANVVRGRPSPTAARDALEVIISMGQITGSSGSAGGDGCQRSSRPPLDHPRSDDQSGRREKRDYRREGNGDDGFLAGLGALDSEGAVGLADDAIEGFHCAEAWRSRAVRAARLPELAARPGVAENRTTHSRAGLESQIARASTAFSRVYLNSWPQGCCNKPSRL
jgi:hypothetical protein